MMAQPTVRSARDLEELNNSNTKFYSFYDDQAAFHSKMPTMRKDLILNKINFSSSYSLELPNNFDENMVYLVTCKYAEIFEKSLKNYRNNHRLFDQRYTLRNGFSFFDEFSRFVSTTLESGIRSYWTKKVFYESSDRHNYIHNAAENEQKDFIEFQDMFLPTVVIIVGSLLALLMFVLEHVKFYRKSIHLKNSKVAPQISRTFKRKTNLRKWEAKFIRKSLKSSSTKEGIVSRKEVEQIIIKMNHEGINQTKFLNEGILRGGYWVSKKLKPRKKNSILMVSQAVVETIC